MWYGSQTLCTYRYFIIHWMYTNLYLQPSILAWKELKEADSDHHQYLLRVRCIMKSTNSCIRHHMCIACSQVFVLMTSLLVHPAHKFYHSHFVSMHDGLIFILACLSVGGWSGIGVIQTKSAFESNWLQLQLQIMSQVTTLYVSHSFRQYSIHTSCKWKNTIWNTS